MSGSIGKILIIGLAVGTYTSLTLVLMRFVFTNLPRFDAAHHYYEGPKPITDRRDVLVGPALAVLPEPDLARMNLESPGRLRSNPPPRPGGPEASGSGPA